MASFKRSEIRDILGEAYTDEIGNKIVGLHLSVIDPLRDEMAALKTEKEKAEATAAKLPELQKELDGYKNGEDYKAKYDKEHEAFETYKRQAAEKEEADKVKAAYRKLLAEEKISEKRLDTVIRATDFSGIKLGKDGNLENVDGLKKKIGEEWADFKVTTQVRHQRVENPPKVDNGGGGMSRAAQLAAQYHAQKYGVAKDADKE